MWLAASTFLVRSRCIRIGVEVPAELLLVTPNVRIAESTSVVVTSDLS